MKILSVEKKTAIHETVIVKNPAIINHDNYKSASPFFLKVRSEEGLKLVDLGRVDNIHDALRVARTKGYEPTRYEQVERGGKRLSTDIDNLPTPGLVRPSQRAMSL